MRRFLGFFLILSLALSLIATAGCGNDAAKAKEFMEEGDKYWNEAATLSGDMNDKLNYLYLQQPIETSEQFAAGAQEVETVLDKLDEIMSSAKAAYEKILDLSGVPDYVDYAEKMVEAVEKGQTVIVMTRQMLSDTEAAIRTAEQGIPPDYDITEAKSEILDVGREIDELENEAQDIKREKDL